MEIQMGEIAGRMGLKQGNREKIIVVGSELVKYKECLKVILDLEMLSFSILIMTVALMKLKINNHFTYK